MDGSRPRLPLSTGIEVVLSRTHWIVALIACSLLIVGVDALTSPHIQFPILFVVPVGLGAWFVARRFAVGLAVCLVLARFALVLGLEDAWQPLWAANLNVVIRLAVLVGLAVLISIARERDRLASHVQALEGLLPICAFCKKIRLSDGSWQAIELYVSEHSAASFTHGFCEACARIHYPAQFPTEGD